MDLFKEINRMKQEAWEKDDDVLLNSLCSLERIAIQSKKHRETKDGKMGEEKLKQGKFYVPLHSCTKATNEDDW